MALRLGRRSFLAMAGGASAIAAGTALLGR